MELVQDTVCSGYSRKGQTQGPGGVFRVYLVARKDDQGSSRIMTRPASWVNKFSKSPRSSRVRSGRVGSGRVGRFLNSPGSGRASLLDPVRPDPPGLTRSVNSPAKHLE